MKPYQERVVAELAELNGKIDKLAAFIHSKEFAAVDPIERELLHDQHYKMIEYAAVLRQRVRRYEA